MIAKIFYINKQGEINSVEVGCRDYRLWLCNLEDFYSSIYKTIDAITKVEFIEGTKINPSVNYTFRIEKEGYIDIEDKEYLSLKSNIWYSFISKSIDNDYDDDYDEHFFILVSITSKGVYYNSHQIDKSETRRMLGEKLSLINLIRDLYLPFKEAELYQLSCSTPREVVEHMIQASIKEK